MDNLFEKMFPNLTDHDSLNLGDVVVITISVAMLLFTGFRSWDIIRQTVPSGWDLITYVGLFALDGGMIGWALVWIFGSTTPAQDGISLTLWFVDCLGVGLAALTDTYMYAPTTSSVAGMVQAVSSAVWWAVPLLALGNGIAGIVYHFTHPAVREKRQERRLRAELQMQAQVGRYHLKRQALQAEQARDLITQRQQVLEAYAKLVEQKRQQDALERQLIGKLLGKDAGGLTSVDEAIRKALDAPMVEAQMKDGDGQQVAASPVPVTSTGGTNHRDNSYYNAFDATPEDGSLPDPTA